MTNKITFNDTVQLDGILSRYISVDVHATGVVVALVTTSNTEEIAAPPFSIDMLWEHIADVDHLSDVFAHEQVRVFKHIVRLLGKVHAQSEVLKDMVA